MTDKKEKVILVDVDSTLVGGKKDTEKSGDENRGYKFFNNELVQALATFQKENPNSKVIIFTNWFSDNYTQPANTASRQDVIDDLKSLGVNISATVVTHTDLYVAKELESVAVEDYQGDKFNLLNNYYEKLELKEKELSYRGHNVSEIKHEANVNLKEFASKMENEYKKHGRFRSENANEYVNSGKYQMFNVVSEILGDNYEYVIFDDKKNVIEVANESNEKVKDFINKDKYNVHGIHVQVCIEKKKESYQYLDAMNDPQKISDFIKKRDDLLEFLYKEKAVSENNMELLSGAFDSLNDFYFDLKNNSAPEILDIGRFWQFASKNIGGFEEKIKSSDFLQKIKYENIKNSGELNSLAPKESAWYCIQNHLSESKGLSVTDRGLLNDLKGLIVNEINYEKSLQVESIISRIKDENENLYFDLTGEEYIDDVLVRCELDTKKYVGLDLGDVLGELDNLSKDKNLNFDVSSNADELKSLILNNFNYHGEYDKKYFADLMKIKDLALSLSKVNKSLDKTLDDNIFIQDVMGKVEMLTNSHTYFEAVIGDLPGVEKVAIENLAKPGLEYYLEELSASIKNEQEKMTSVLKNQFPKAYGDVEIHYAKTSEATVDTYYSKLLDQVNQVKISIDDQSKLQDCLNQVAMMMSNVRFAIEEDAHNPYSKELGKMDKFLNDSVGMLAKIFYKIVNIASKAFNVELNTLKQTAVYQSVHKVVEAKGARHQTAELESKASNTHAMFSLSEKMKQQHQSAASEQSDLDESSTPKPGK